jgi:hypothetical protein
VANISYLFIDVRNFIEEDDTSATRVEILENHGKRQLTSERIVNYLTSFPSYLQKIGDHKSFHLKRLTKKKGLFLAPYYMGEAHGDV